MRRNDRLAGPRGLALAALLALPAAAATQEAGNYYGKAPFGSAAPTELSAATVKWYGPDGQPLADPPSDAGVVVHQDPLPGDKLADTGSVLSLVVSPKVVVPDLSGMTVAAANRVAGRLGLEVVARTEQGVVSNDPEALIASNDVPQTTDALEPGTSINVGGTVGVILVSPGSFFSSAATCGALFVAGALIATLVTRSIYRGKRGSP